MTTARLDTAEDLESRWRKTGTSVRVVWADDGESLVGTLVGGLHGRRVLKPVALPPRRPRGEFIASARWEGLVLECFASYFLAEVIRLRSEEKATVEFEFDEVAPHDLPLCEPGALFYWAIGYETKQSGQRRRVS